MPPGLQLTNGTGTTTSSTARPTKTRADTNAVQVWRVTGRTASGRPTQLDLRPETKCCSFQIGTSALTVSISCATRGQRVTPVHRADRHHHRQVADLEVADPVLDGDGDHVVTLGDLAPRSAAAPPRRSGAGCSPGRRRPHPRSWSRITTDEERDPADVRVAHQAEQPVHAERRVGDARRPDA